MERTKFNSWKIENGSTLSEQEILNIFIELGNIFGFQRDNVSNMFDHFMTQLDSRSSRMRCPTALLSLHLDYIGGKNSNYKKWFFAAQLNFDNDNSWNPKKKKKKQKSSAEEESNDQKWARKFQGCSESDYVYHIALYLLIWGEANNVRFIPECICFIFQCAFDYWQELRTRGVMVTDEDVLPSNHPEFHFLDQIITPIYKFIRDQQYYKTDTGRWERKEIDHANTIGYDDINQQFWSAQGLYKIKLGDGRRLYEFSKVERYLHIGEINWEKTFSKTYRERRTWIHLITNFNRVWIIHVPVFWYFMSLNSPSLYTPDFVPNKEPQMHVRLAIVSLGGVIASLLALAGDFAEYIFVPRRVPNKSRIWHRIFFLLILTIVNVSPLVYTLGLLNWDQYSHNGVVVGGVSLTVSILTVIYLAIATPGDFPGTAANNTFSGSFPKLKLRSRIFSCLLWICVFVAKYSESYFFLILSMKDPIQILSTIVLNCSDRNFICKFQPKLALSILYLTDLILFFLDTYLWYVICNCIFSVGLSFSLGVSIFTPWRNIFCRLPERLSSKIYSQEDGDSPELNLSQLWNTIVFSLYREHLLSVEQVSKLVYQRGINNNNPIRPVFFVYADDNTFQLHDFFTIGKECERRITFFAQSLSSPLPEPFEVVAIPAFTVLIPHYNEKILISLEELIQSSSLSKLTLLEYLKQLYPSEWDAFVKDNKMLETVDVVDDDDIVPILNTEIKDVGATETVVENKNKSEELPLYCLGFKDETPENILRTSIWATLRCQTLYRTVSGFMNYETALKVLYKIEDFGFETDEYSEVELEDFVSRKFNLLVAMQNLQNTVPLNKEAETLFKAFPNLKVAHLETVKINDEVTEYYSTLLDVSRTDDEGKLWRKYRIKLSGNPILGDGKSDNQNHSIIFYRGEYIQVIDANQDNYLEECLKIKSLLSEFEEINIDIGNGYDPESIDTQDDSNPVAILGAREYIFSQNIGILGDIAAGKEQTFGTLFARTMGEIGSKLHYGHPDFLNGIFMSTRGGISKAQRGLHLNEDIYAGMTATCRGGRIKHCDYYQCGKGRDLGFESIINFTTKIGAGMGEQLLSREYFYLGTKLPIDRFLSFYYAHPGFHINNLSIMLSVKMFMLLVSNLGALNYGTISCTTQPADSSTECHDLGPVLNWIDRFVLSVFVCFFISFLPLIIQELIEKGFVKAIYRIIFQVISLSPFFEVFVCQIYSKSLRDNLIFGQAQYIGTGRGFAISRVAFSKLYSQYAGSSIYYGCEIFLVILFASLTIWRKALIWFVITIISLCLAPFLFNPHQFSMGDFFVDYGNYIKWLSSGNSSKAIKSSWIHHAKTKRSKLTGEKQGSYSRGRNSSLFNLLTGEVFSPFITTLLYLCPYLFINSGDNFLGLNLKNPLLKILLITLAPYLENAAVLIILWPLSILLAPFIGHCYKSLPATIAAVAHLLSILVNIINIVFLFFLEDWNVVQLISASLVIFNLHRVICHCILIVFVSRERSDNITDNISNKAWWSGKWFGSGLGFSVITQHLREFLVKILELNKFTLDFLIGHFLLIAMFPILFIPYIDRWHTSMLFWLKPMRQISRPVFTKREKRRRKWDIFWSLLLFVVIMLFLVAVIIVPPIVDSKVFKLKSTLPPMISRIIDPALVEDEDL
ncbi:13-beta-glucan synthase component FKS3 [Spathaspora sp. JA1]|nr:13-beta-glucan synthase component FKS3 [Spathaspora sp. JA1]